MMKRRSSCIPRVYNLLVDLDGRFGSASMAKSRRVIEAAGCELAIHRGAPDRVLAWIDEAFGGSWSSEAFAGSNVVVTCDGAPAAFATFDPQGLRFAWLRGAAAEEDAAIFGPFGVDRAFRGTGVGPAVLNVALAELHARGYARAVIAAVGEPSLVRYYAQHVNARVAETFEPFAFVGRPPRTVILASGSGTNAQAVIDAVKDGRLPLDLRALVSNRAAARALERAHTAGISAEAVLWHREPSMTRAQYDAHLLERVAAYEPELVLLLGWMHLLDERFVDGFGAVLNVHPAFLPLDSSRDAVGMPNGDEIPAFRGAHAVADALAAGSRWIGATVHEVTAETDRGPVLARKPLALLDGENEETALARLHPIEHGTVEAALRRWLYER